MLCVVSHLYYVYDPDWSDDIIWEWAASWRRKPSDSIQWLHRSTQRTDLHTESWSQPSEHRYCRQIHTVQRQQIKNMGHRVWCVSSSLFPQECSHCWRRSQPVQGWWRACCLGRMSAVSCSASARTPTWLHRWELGMLILTYWYLSRCTSLHSTQVYWLIQTRKHAWQWTQESQSDRSFSLVNFFPTM